MGRTFVDTHPAPQTPVGMNKLCRFPMLVFGHRGILDPQGLDRAPLDAQTARLAALRPDPKTVIRRIMALFVLENAVGLEENTGTRAAIADGVRAFFPV